MNIPIVLKIEDWNVILNALGQRPYIEVAEIITRVKMQADVEVKKAEANLLNKTDEAAP
jgi:hypothetical protein